MPWQRASLMAAGSGPREASWRWRSHRERRAAQRRARDASERMAARRRMESPAEHEVRRRMAMVVPSLQDLVAGRPADAMARLRRNVALHLAWMPELGAAASQ